MDAKALKTIRQRLAIEYENLTRLIRRGRLDADEIRIENTEDEGDLATISHARELFYNLQEGDVARLRSIEEAMKSLDRGRYGKCVRCSEDINEKRLEVVPWARMCLVCRGETEMEASMVLIGSGGEEQEL
jgi:RNA polymerase-binding transcription factor DksA